MDIFRFLDEHKFSLRWLLTQLDARGLDMSRSFLYQALRGERTSKFAEETVKAARSICEQYERSITANAKVIKNGC